jgi:hypothetical protein
MPDMERPDRKLGTWAVIFGTLMIAIACFDAAWGLATVALGEQLLIIAGQLENHHLAMSLGRLVHFVTFGVFNVSGVETGEHARSLLNRLPRPGYIVEVGWIRFCLSSCGVILGLILAYRSPRSIQLVLVWCIVSLGWTVWATIQTWALTMDTLGDSTSGGSIPMFSIELALHFLWPVVLGSRCGLEFISRFRSIQ